MKRVDEEKIRELFEAGCTYDEIRLELGVSTATVSKVRRRLGLPGRKTGPKPWRLASRKSRRSKFDWVKIQKYYDAGHGTRETQRHFSISSCSWQAAKRRGELVLRAPSDPLPLEELLVRGRQTGRTHLKRRLFAAGLLQERCYDCGIVEWCGKPLSLHLDHINGVPDDNRLENLRLLCPNCHSQTPTFCRSKASLAGMAKQQTRSV